MSITKGPWIFDSGETQFYLAYGEVLGGDDDGRLYVFKEDDPEQHVCTIDNTEGRGLADAKAISAVPEMMEALEESLVTLKCLAPLMWERYESMLHKTAEPASEIAHERAKQCDESIRQIEQALAKAKGEER